MGIFFRVFAACVAADAIDRKARQPSRYWYPNHRSLPPPGTTIASVQLPSPAHLTPRQAAGWDLEHPERPQ
jgi:hypothetical protein